jgi:hypothetical protein
MAGSVMIPWYATGLRGDDFAKALDEAAAVSLRYGATSYAVYRSRDDLYRFQQFVVFEDKIDWERYWEGDEMIYFRTVHSSWYQVPVLYSWWDQTAAGGLASKPAGNGTNGHTNGVRTGELN